MSKIATVLIDLLCYISVEPDAGLDVDETADLQIDSWQTLIHDLTGPEKALIKAAAKLKFESLQKLDPLKTTAQQEQIMDILHAFFNDTLQ